MTIKRHHYVLTLVFTCLLAIGFTQSRQLVNLVSADSVSPAILALRAKGDFEITNRLNSITKALQALDASKELSSSVRTPLRLQLSNQAGGLQNLKLQIDSDTNISTLNKELQAIKTNYRVYLLTMPKVDMLIAGDRIVSSSQTLSAWHDRLQKQVDDLKKQGKTVPELQKKLDSMDADITAARNKAKSVITDLVNLSVPDFNQNMKVLQDKLTELQVAQQSAKSANTEGTDAETMLAKAQTRKPNIVFVMVDDLDLSLMQYMPKAKKYIADRGATFTNYYDNISLCCAARSSILRGQYAHNTHVLDNHWPNGGYGVFHQSAEKSTIATWLLKANYKTVLMGKYMNEYPNVTEDPSKGVADTFVPPGWTNWVSPVSGNAYGEWNYKFNVNGVVDKEKRGHDKAGNYMVDTISDMADSFVKNQDGSFFAYLAPYAPHSPYTPAPRYVNDPRFKDVTYPDTPAFNEANISDKSELFSTKKLTDKNIANINAAYRKRVESVQAVDDMVEHIYGTLKATGKLNNTYIVFTSDNGYHMGEHRQAPGKNTMYDTDIHLPLYVAGPGITAGSTINEVVGNVDLAPTFADMAGTSTPDFVDGKSLIPLLTGQHPSNWRKFYLIERGGTETNAAVGSGLLEPLDDVSRPQEDNVTPYSGVRSANQVYVEYTDGNREMYDLSTDPYELNNLLANNKNKNKQTAAFQSNVSALKNALDKLRNCKSTSCVQ